MNYFKICFNLILVFEHNLRYFRAVGSLLLSYGNRKELLFKAKDAKSTPIPLLTGSMCCLGSQSSVVQNNVTADEDAMYALYEAIVEDRTWNVNKPKSITKQEEPFYSSTVPYLSLHDASPCPPESLIDVSNPSFNMQEIHNPEVCVELVISTINKLKSTTSKKNHSTPLPVHLSLHDASPCPPESLIDVSNPTTNMQEIHDPEFCVEVVILTINKLKPTTSKKNHSTPVPVPYL